MTPAIEHWPKIPTAWIRHDDGLKHFSIKDAGSNTAALKIYIAIALRTPLFYRPPDTHAGLARVSYNEFQEMTGIGFGLIARGVTILKEMHKIEVLATSRTHAYRLVGFDTDRWDWGKLPHERLQSIRPGLALLRNRSPKDLAVLKIYLALIAFRDDPSGFSTLSYDRMMECTGVQKSLIHPALECLYEAHLVSLDPRTDRRLGWNTAIRYVVEGFPSPRSGAGFAPGAGRWVVESPDERQGE